jgi:hypothetical protein
VSFSSWKKRAVDFYGGYGVDDLMEHSGNPVMSFPSRLRRNRESATGRDPLRHVGLDPDETSDAYRNGLIASLAQPIPFAATALNAASKGKKIKKAQSLSRHKRNSSRFKEETKRIKSDTARRERINNEMARSQNSKASQERRKQNDQLKESVRRNRRAEDKTPPSERSKETRKIVEEITRASKKRNSYAAHRRRQS